MPGCTTTERGIVCATHFAHKPGARNRHQKCSEFAPCPWRLRGAQCITSVCGCVWASWADCLPMIQARHPEVANMFLEKLEGWPDTPFLGAPAVSARTLTGTMGFEPPSWRALMELVQNLRNQMSLSQQSHVKGGSTKLRPESKDISGTECSSVVWRLVSVLWCGRKLVQEQVSLSQSIPLLIGRGSRHTSSEWSSYDASVCPCPCLCIHAGVAARSITTEQRTRGRECWGAGVRVGKRSRSHL